MIPLVTLPPGQVHEASAEQSLGEAGAREDPHETVFGGEPEAPLHERRVPSRRFFPKRSADTVGCIADGAWHPFRRGVRLSSPRPRNGARRSSRSADRRNGRPAQSSESVVTTCSYRSPTSHEVLDLGRIQVCEQQADAREENGDWVAVRAVEQLQSLSCRASGSLLRHPAGVAATGARTPCRAAVQNRRRDRSTRVERAPNSSIAGSRVPVRGGHSPRTKAWRARTGSPPSMETSSS